MKFRGALMMAFAGLLLPAILPAQIRTNTGFRQKSIPANDDGFAPVEALGWTANFFGRQRNSVFVNNNGNITFDSALRSFDGIRGEIAKYPIR